MRQSKTFTGTLTETGFPRLYPGDVQFVGTFRVPNLAGVDSFANSGICPAYNPANNSLFLAGGKNCIAELAIPSTIVNSTNLNSLTRATVLQPFQGILPNLQNKLVGATDGAPLGGLLVSNGRLIGTQFAYYSGANQQVLSHFYLDSLNLSTATIHGLYQLGSGGRKYAGVMCPVPPSWQTALGFPTLTCLWNASIDSACSCGPGAFGFDPGALGPVAGPTNTCLYYPASNQLGNYTGPPNPQYSGTILVNGGMVFPPGSSTVLYFASTGTSWEGYGSTTQWGDTIHGGQGPHSLNGQYAWQFWAYDVNDLAAVVAGTKHSYQVVPYACWNVVLPFPAHLLVGGMCMDTASGRIYVVTQNGDNSLAPSTYLPLVQVFQVTVPTQAPSGPPLLGTLAALPYVTPPYPGPIHIGDTVALWAGNVFPLTPGARVVSVAFQVSGPNNFSSSGNAVADIIDPNASQNWYATFPTAGLSAGTYTASATATDSNGQTSLPVSTNFVLA